MTIEHEEKEEEEEADRKCSRLIASWRRKAIIVVESRRGMDAKGGETIYSIHGRTNTDSCLDAQTAPVSSFFLSHSFSIFPASTQDRLVLRSRMRYEAAVCRWTERLGCART